MIVLKFGGTLVQDAEALDIVAMRRGEKAGLHHRRFHDFRHSYASLLLTDGVPIAYVSEQMGHASIELAAKRYGHLIPGKNRHFVNSLPGAEIQRMMAAAGNG